MNCLSVLVRFPLTFRVALVLTAVVLVRPARCATDDVTFSGLNNLSASVKGDSGKQRYLKGEQLAWSAQQTPPHDGNPWHKSLPTLWHTFQARRLLAGKDEPQRLGTAAPAGKGPQIPLWGPQRPPCQPAKPALPTAKPAPLTGSQAQGKPTLKKEAVFGAAKTASSTGGGSKPNTQVPGGTAKDSSGKGIQGKDDPDWDESLDFKDLDDEQAVKAALAASAAQKPMPTSPPFPQRVPPKAPVQVPRIPAPVKPSPPPHKASPPPHMAVPAPHVPKMPPPPAPRAGVKELPKGVSYAEMSELLKDDVPTEDDIAESGKLVRPPGLAANKTLRAPGTTLARPPHLAQSRPPAAPVFSKAPVAVPAQHPASEPWRLPILPFPSILGHRHNWFCPHLLPRKPPLPLPPPPPPQLPPPPPPEVPTLQSPHPSPVPLHTEAAHQHIPEPAREPPVPQETARSVPTGEHLAEPTRAKKVGVIASQAASGRAVGSGAGIVGTDVSMAAPPSKKSRFVALEEALLQGQRAHGSPAVHRGPGFEREGALSSVSRPIFMSDRKPDIEKDGGEDDEEGEEDSEGGAVARLRGRDRVSSWDKSILPKELPRQSRKGDPVRQSRFFDFVALAEVREDDDISKGGMAIAWAWDAVTRHSELSNLWHLLEKQQAEEIPGHKMFSAIMTAVMFAVLLLWIVMRCCCRRRKRAPPPPRVSPVQSCAGASQFASCAISIASQAGDPNPGVRARTASAIANRGPRQKAHFLRVVP
eukprot:jgi/Botrbrau1/16674/Bobra.0068s0090.1